MPATYEPIATTTLGSAASTITFSTIPATYTDLRLVILNRNDQVAGQSYMVMKFNSTSANYSATIMTGNGSTTQTLRRTSDSAIYCFYFSPNLGTGIYSMFTLDMFNYAGSTNKTGLYTASADNNGAGNVDRGVIMWSNTSAINRIDFTTTGNFVAGCTATLYGILKA